MIYQLAVPRSIDEVTELHVLQWHAAPDRPVTQGALLLELETHKVIVEIRAERDGFLRQVICGDDGWQKVGGILALLSDDADEPLPEDTNGLPDYMVALEIV